MCMTSLIKKILKCLVIGEFFFLNIRTIKGYFFKPILGNENCNRFLKLVNLTSGPVTKSYTLTVVYFDQHLGAVHPNHWLKS